MLVQLVVILEVNSQAFGDCKHSVSVRVGEQKFFVQALSKDMSAFSRAAWAYSPALARESN